MVHRILMALLLADGVDVPANEPGKIPLTQEFLTEEYSKHFEMHSQMYSIFSIFIIVFIALIILFTVISVVRTVRKMPKRDEYGEDYQSSSVPSSVTRWLPLIFVVPALIGIGVIAINFFGMKNSEPKPEEANYNVYYIDVIRKDIEEHISTNSDNHTTDTTKLYYLYIKDTDATERKMKVSLDMYDTVTGPGLYYIAYAETDSQHYAFAIYPPATYTLVK